MLKNKVAIITGSTRGIGKEIALTLAKNGCNIVVAGKSTKDTPNLPGNIYSVAEEIENYNVQAVPFQIDVRNNNTMINLVNSTVNRFGKIDILINNAGALWWENMLNCPIEKYDLINNINSRASYALSQLCLPHMLENKWGHIIMQSPPFNGKYIDKLINTNKLKNKVGYMSSKLGMSITAVGIGQEFRGTGVAANSIWPQTPIESYALINNNLGNRKQWRKPEILCDSIMHILQEDSKIFTGNCLIDEEYLKTKGVTDFSKYQCVPGYEPPTLDSVDEMLISVGKKI